MGLARTWRASRLVGRLLGAAALSVALASLTLVTSLGGSTIDWLSPVATALVVLTLAAGWLFFGYAPSGYLWIGAAMILGASLFMLTHELRQGANLPTKKADMDSASRKK